MDTNKRELLGRYQIVSELGSGGMGTVYLTRDTTLQRDVAIKVLNDATVVDAVSVERFKREVKASGCYGVHFEDHAELRDFHCVEESHLSKRDGIEFTKRVVEILRRDQIID